MDDIRAVMDAAGSRRAALFGVSDGGCLCIAFAVAHPECLAALITYGSFARRLRSADYPWGWPAEHLEEVLRGMSRREREIVALTCAGETAPAIAAALFLSERTVESHLGRAYVKLGVHSKLELARRAAELGLTRDSL